MFPLLGKPTGGCGFFGATIGLGCTGSGEVLVQVGALGDVVGAVGVKPSATSSSDFSSRFQLDELRANQMQKDACMTVDERPFKISLVDLASNPRRLKVDFVDVEQYPLAPTSIGKISTLQPCDLICSARGV